jgi:hypothetical protein
MSAQEYAMITLPSDRRHGWRFWASPSAARATPTATPRTAAPVLNVNDFTCFLNAFAAGEWSANCDGSTAASVLNVNDFTCFVNAFAAGCG